MLVNSVTIGLLRVDSCRVLPTHDKSVQIGYHINMSIKINTLTHTLKHTQTPTHEFIRVYTCICTSIHVHKSAEISGLQKSPNKTGLFAKENYRVATVSRID